MSTTHRFILTLGSNTQAEHHIAYVQKRLFSFGGCRLRCSTPRRSAPVEFPLSSTPFTDVVIVGDTHDELTLFSRKLKELEREAGRTPEQRATRPEEIPIDIDLITWDEKILKPRDLSRPYLRLGLTELGVELPQVP